MATSVSPKYFKGRSNNAGWNGKCNQVDPWHDMHTAGVIYSHGIAKTRAEDRRALSKARRRADKHAVNHNICENA